MSKKDEFELAKDLFIKRCGTSYLNDQNKAHYKSTAKDCIALAKMFVEEFEKKDEEK